MVLLSIVLVVCQVASFVQNGELLMMVSTDATTAGDLHDGSSSNNLYYTTPAANGGIPRTASGTAMMENSSGSIYYHRNSAVVAADHHEHAGYIREEISCVYENGKYNGSLLAGTNAIVFTGSFLLLFDKTLVLKWDDIRKVVKSNNNSIEIIMSNSHHKNADNKAAKSVYTFENIHNPDKVWLLLMTLHNDSLLGRHHQRRKRTRTATADDHDIPTANPPRYSMMKRRNSDPPNSAMRGLTSELLLEPPPPPPDEKQHKQSAEEDTTPAKAIMGTVLAFGDELDTKTIQQTTGQYREEPVHCQYYKLSSRPSQSQSNMSSNNSFQKGKLYIGEHAIYFVAKRFWWDFVTIKLSWSMIRQIQLVPASSAVGESSTRTDESSRSSKKSVLKIRTNSDSSNKSKETTTTTTTTPTVFEFQLLLDDNDTNATTKKSSGNDSNKDASSKETQEQSQPLKPDELWASLIALHNEKLQIQHRSRASSLTLASSTTNDNDNTSAEECRRKSLRRMTSDPINQFLHLQDDDDDDDPLANLYNGFDDDDTITPLATTPLAAADSSADGGGPNKSASGDFPTSTTTTAEDWKSTDTTVYTNRVIDGRVIEIERKDCTTMNLDEFYNLFWKDNAKYSLAQFLQRRGDTNIHTTNWKNVKEDSGGPSAASASASRSRIVTYLHPVNAPLAPPEANARKEQKLTRYENTGLLIQTETYVEDVPMTDCFYVTDRILVEQRKDDDDSNKKSFLILTMEFGITFVKSTMFKGVISKKTTSEFTDLFEAMAEFVQDAVDGKLDIAPDKTTEDTTQKSPTTTTPGPAASDRVSRRPLPRRPVRIIPEGVLTIDRFVLLLVVLLQVWILLELRTMKKGLVAVHHHQHSSSTVEDNDNQVCPAMTN